MDITVYGDKAAGKVLIQTVDDHDLAFMEKEINAIRERTDESFCLAAFRVGNWNRDLSPWPAPPVFGRDAFGDGAEDTLKEILSYCTDDSKAYYIGGYSLAGLFALWAVYRTDLFLGAAAASPSVWFPGFTDYMRKSPIRCGAVYLSLGDREEKTRNPVMATVGQRIREAHGILSAGGTPCALEWNKGNHFMDADTRCAKAFAWVMAQSMNK